VVGVLVRLKLTLLRGQARGGVEKVLLLVASVLVALSLGGTALAGLVGLRFVGLDLAGAVAVLGGAVAVLGWSLVPLLTSTDDVLVDPVRFALFPLPPRTLAAGLLATTAVSPTGAMTVLSSLALAVTFSRGPVPVASVLVALLGALVGSATCLLASRAVLTSAAAALAGRRGRELTFGVGVALMSMLGLAGPLLGVVADRLRSGTVDAFVQVLAWSPLGAAWSAPWAAAEGRWGVAAARLLVGAGHAGTAVAGVPPGAPRRLRPSGSTRSRPARATRVGRDRGPALLPDTPLGALVGRALRYWVRDSRYQMSVIVLPVVVGMLLVLPGLTDAPPGFALVTGPLAGLLLGITMLNELAFDGSALWTHLAAGVRGRDDRSARVLALLLWAGRPPRPSRCSGPWSAGAPTWRRPRSACRSARCSWATRWRPCRRSPCRSRFRPRGPTRSPATRARAPRRWCSRAQHPGPAAAPGPAAGTRPRGPGLPPRRAGCSWRWAPSTGPGCSRSASPSADGSWTGGAPSCWRA
jgi:ABC-2 type transport system permease protein